MENDASGFAEKTDFLFSGSNRALETKGIVKLTDDRGSGYVYQDSLLDF